MVGPYFERAVTDWVHGAGLDLSPFELRLGRAVDLDAGPFVGRDALIALRAGGITRRLVGVRFGTSDVPGIEGLRWRLAATSGEGTVLDTHASLLLGETIGYAVVDNDLATGTDVTVDTPTGRVAAWIVELPFVP